MKKTAGLRPRRLWWARRGAGDSGEPPRGRAVCVEMCGPVKGGEKNWSSGGGVVAHAERCILSQCGGWRPSLGREG